MRQREEGPRTTGAMDTRVDATPYAASKRRASQDHNELLLNSSLAPRVTIPPAMSAAGAPSSSSGIATTTAGAHHVQASITPKDPFVKAAETHMHNMLDAYQRLAEGIDSAGKLACLGCKSRSCNGFRETGKALCPAFGRKNGLICFKCGAPHYQCERQWQALLGRCKFCFMPWDEVLGCTFHCGGVGRGKSALSQAPETCRVLGDAIKSSLARLWRSNEGTWAAFVDDVKHHCVAPLPTRGEDIDPFILWLGRPTVWGNGTLHIDLAIEHVLTRQ